MAPDSSPEKKGYSFTTVSRAEWEKAALIEWKSSAVVKKPIALSQGLEIKPYYDLGDVPSLIGSQLPACTQEFLGARAWLNMPLIRVNDDSKANQTALDWLNSGADGILFQLAARSDPKILLKGIDLPFCNISFLVDESQESFFQRFDEWVAGKNYDTQSIAGGIFWNATLPNPAKLVNRFRDWGSFHSLGIVAYNESNSLTDDIAGLLVKAVKQIDVLSKEGLEVLDALKAITFSVTVSTDFFLTIAQLKTLRMLWFQIATSYLPTHSAPAFIHTSLEPWIRSEYSPQSNLLRSTTAAMSAILGGSDAVTIQAEDPSDKTSTRITRNISSILAEESHLSKVADPTAGSYFLECLIDQIAQEAWRKFQNQL